MATVISQCTAGSLDTYLSENDVDIGTKAHLCIQVTVALFESRGLR